MNQALRVWFEFAACIALIGAAGPQLCRAGSIIGEKLGLSGHWIGLTLIATTTSLPELITGISSVTIADTPDIAVGNVLGSCMFNLAFLAVLDLFCRPRTVYERADQGHILSAGWGILLISFVGLSLIIPGGSVFSVGHIGFSTPIILVLYGLAMRSVFSYEKCTAKERSEDVADPYPQITLRRAILRYAAASIVVMAAGAWLPFVGAGLADTMGWQRSFVGTLLVAWVTTVPEFVVTLAALRIGALNMAVANLLGSNLFNIAVLAVDDIFFFRGPLLSSVSPIHAVSAFSVVGMTGLVIVGLIYRPQSRLFQSVSWISLGLLSMYLINSSLLYLDGE